MSIGIDLDGQEGSMMSGVFRWKLSHKLRSLPVISNDDIIRVQPKLDFSKGWMEYFRSRCSNEAKFTQLVQYVQEDLCLIDCLSFPMSILNAVMKTKILGDTGTGTSTSSAKFVVNQQLDGLHIVCLGCSAKAEERILRETLCFYEIGLALGHRVGKRNGTGIHLYLVGPEMSRTQSNIQPQWSSSSSSSLPRMLTTEYMAMHTFKGTSADFFKGPIGKPLLPIPNFASCDGAAVSGTYDVEVNTIAIGYNCGYGNYENPGQTKYNLLISWYSDLSFLMSMQCLTCVFTCANDYAGEY